jgi:signal transduction histidine kinase
VGRAAVELPWLCPETDSLIALADAPARLNGLSAADPGLALFLLRFAAPAPEPDIFGFAPGALFSAILPETATAFLGATQAGVLPNSSFALGRVRALSERAGAFATLLAEATRLVPPAAAATVARLTPLGWYAVAAVDQFDAADPLADPSFPDRPADIQAAVWGLDHTAITRRLAARWRLPAWVGSTVGCLTLPLRVAGRLVAHRDLFAVVQLAVLEAEAHGLRLGLADGADRGELLDLLRLDDRGVAGIVARTPEPSPRPACSRLDPNPHRVPLVRNLLRLAAESRRRNGRALVARLEDQIDGLYRLSADLGKQLGERLRDAKLAGLAELAAGAGHEINNPLAVISANAQRLLRTEPNPERNDALRAIVRQAHRIAGILRDLMEFARPPRPVGRAFPVSQLLDAVRDEFAPLAAERSVRLDVEHAPGVWLDADPQQLTQALGATVRNALEATPCGGWVRVTCTATEEASVALAVEDSGPGLAPDAAEHAFDPFYSGRKAGRGRGLGLSTAWRLARQNGGDVRYDPTTEGRTRFVLTARRAAEQELSGRQSA